MSKVVKESCENCEFNFGNVCAGHGRRTDNGDDTYGMPIKIVEKMFPNGCNDYGISLDGFIEQEKLKNK